jgi:hypothetical protein
MRSSSVSARILYYIDVHTCLFIIAANNDSHHAGDGGVATRRRRRGRTLISVQVQVLFYAIYGHVFRMAEAIPTGAPEVEVAEMSLYQVPGDGH